MAVPLMGISQLSRDQFPLDRTFKNGFVYFAPGLTYTAAFPENTSEVNVVDTTYRITSTPGGKFSYAFELGWYHSFENPSFFHYLEFGLAYRSFAGSSDVELSKLWDEFEVKANQSADYNIRSASALFRAIRAKQLGKHTFLTFGPGINFDYHLSDNRSYTTDVFENPEQEMKLQAHFQIGVGFRLTETVIFLPQLEVPLLEAYPTGKWDATHQFTENNLYPFLLSFKIMLLRKDPVNCNAPPAPKGY